MKKNSNDKMQEREHVTSINASGRVSNVYFRMYTRPFRDTLLTPQLERMYKIHE